MDILLIAGLWLDGSAWDDVVPPLRELGHRPVPLTLPGQGDGRQEATLADQVSAVRAAVDSAAGRPLVVGHSAASTLAWLAADARPEKVAGLVLIGGWPQSDGEPYAGFFPGVDGVVPFPGWGPFEGPDSDDLDEQGRRSFAAAAIPVPEGVTSGVVRLSDDRRYGVPVVLVCPSSAPLRSRSGSPPVSWPSSRRPSAWNSSISSRATGRCSPGPSNWPECWLRPRRTSAADDALHEPALDASIVSRAHRSGVTRPQASAVGSAPSAASGTGTRSAAYRPAAAAARKYARSSG
jgi:pimeloyl-ACP methyl ester carboxylesterase